MNQTQKKVGAILLGILAAIVIIATIVGIYQYLDEKLSRPAKWTEQVIVKPNYPRSYRTVDPEGMCDPSWLSYFVIGGRDKEDHKRFKWKPISGWANAHIRISNPLNRTQTWDKVPGGTVGLMTGIADMKSLDNKLYTLTIECECVGRD